MPGCRRDAESSLTDWGMPITPRFLSRPTGEDVLRDTAGRDVTYREIGASLQPRLPDGYRHERASAVIGNGDQAFASGCAALRAWAGHRYLNFAITPENALLDLGVTIVARIPLGPLLVLAPC